MTKRGMKFGVLGTMVLVTIGIALCFGSNPSGVSKSASNATPASTPASKYDKHAMLHKGHHPYGLSGKGGGQIEVSMTSDVATPIPASRAFTVTATVGATTSLDDLQFEWILPEGVAKTSGSLSGPLGDLADGGTANVSIQLVTSTDENRQIHLHVYRLVGGEPTGQMSQFNTRDESKLAEQMNAKVQALGVGRGPASSGDEPRRRIYQ